MDEMNEKDSFSFVCGKCGKPGKSDSAGSITGWIRQEHLCDCPNPIFERVDSDTDRSWPKLPFPYEIVANLGGGGMGDVFKVRNVENETFHAVKLVQSHLYSDMDSLRRFEREIEIMKRFSHHGLVKVEGHGVTEEGRHYLVMEYIDGQSLAELLQEETRLEERRALGLFIQVLDALSHMHLQGIVHRDLKPANILIEKNDSGEEIVRIVDFGIVKVLDRDTIDSTSITRTGDIFGSPFYMSPEQCQGDEIGPLSDIYSLGCLMYECLTGSPPFDDDSPVKIVLQHLYDNPRSMNSFDAAIAISESMEEVVLICMAKDPENRYKSASSLCGDLKRIEKGEPIKKRRGDNAPYGVKVAKQLLLFVLTVTVLTGTVLSFALLKDYSWFLNLSKINSMSYAEKREKSRVVDDLVSVASDHNKPFAKLLQAEFLYDSRDLNGAGKSISEGLKLLQERGDKSQNLQPFYRLLIAIELDQGKLETARKYFSKLYQLAIDDRHNHEGVKGISIFQGFYLPAPVVVKEDVLADFADACMARGYYKEAESIYDKAMTLAKEEDNERFLFKVVRKRAVLADKLDRSKQASSLRQEALSLLRKPQLSGSTFLLRRLGDDYLAAGDYKSSTAIYKSLGEQVDVSDSDRFLDRLRLAYSLSLEGELGEAESIYKKLESKAAPDFNSFEGRRVLRAYANFYTRAKRYSEAKSAYRRVLQIYKKSDNPMRLATVGIRLAIATALSGDLEEAQRVFAESESAFQRINFGQLQDDGVFEEYKFLLECARYKSISGEMESSREFEKKAKILVRELSPNTLSGLLERDRAARIVDGDYLFFEREPGNDD